MRHLILLLLIIPGARAQSPEPTLSLPLALRTFPEIAKVISVEGRQVECAASLHNCTALVCLKNRTWDQALKILSAGLDVRFRSRSEKSWVMERDPKVFTRERAWQRIYAANLREHAWATLTETPVLQQPWTTAKARYEELIREIETTRSTGNEIAIGTLAREYDAVRLKADPAGELSMRLLRLFLQGTQQDILTADGSFRPVDLARVADPELAQALWVYSHARGQLHKSVIELAGKYPVPDDLTALWSVNTGHGFGLSTRLLVCGGHTATYVGGFGVGIGPMSTDTLFRGYEGPDLYDTPRRYRGLGEEAVGWLEAEREATRMFLRAPEAKQEFVLPPTRPVTSLSQVAEAWARDTDGEVVMELCPLREELGPSGARLYELAPGGHYILAQVWREEAFWTFRGQEGVLLVKNQTAFLDRMRELPMAGFLALEKEWQERAEGETLIPRPSLNGLLAYTRLSSAVQNGRWPHGLIYRGIAMAEMARARPLLVLLNRLSPLQRKEMARAVESRQPYVVSLARFADRDIQDAVESYRCLSGQNPFSWHPQFSAYLRACLLRVEPTPGTRIVDTETGPILTHSQAFGLSLSLVAETEAAAWERMREETEARLGEVRF